MKAAGLSSTHATGREYPSGLCALHGYEALGTVVHDVTAAAYRRWRTGRERRREVRLLRVLYALPAAGGKRSRPVR